MRQTAEEFLGDSLWVQLSKSGQLYFQKVLSSCKTYGERFEQILGNCCQADYGMQDPAKPSAEDTRRFDLWKRAWIDGSFRSFTFNWFMQPHPTEWPHEHSLPKVYVAKSYSKSDGNYIVSDCFVPTQCKTEDKKDVQTYTVYVPAPSCVLLAYSTLVIPAIRDPNSKRALAQDLMSILVEVYDKRSEQRVGRETHTEATYRHIKSLIDELKR